ncbi:siderophore-interacting protein [Pseudoclavibacter sp. AY1H1]|uniref:siderophore-interacting protein n=1 Tax=Pseudoclavibacter sp. AY1H1 TaxID=2080584 RepID=UPI0015E2C58D|nr:siderophore-interacting protein [Pseudoclavibacter sp. AY1H1]
MSPRSFVAHPLVLRRLSVVRTSEVTPRMCRITLGGEQLGAFEREGMCHPRFASPMFDDHVKLLFATEGPVDDVLPHQLPHGIEWTVSETRAGRDYTLRHVREDELDLDFVLHADNHDAGPAEAWARAARPGDEVWFVGPKSSSVIPDNTDRVVLIGDETALPAIGRFFEERPVAVPVHAVVLVGDDAARQELALRAGDRLEWVLAEPGDADAVGRAVTLLDDEAFAGSPYVWAAAESRALLPLRRALSRVHRIPKSHQDITGYWHARTNAPSTIQNVARDEATRCEPVPSPTVWFTIRAALRLGVIDALDKRECTTHELAKQLQVRAGSLDTIIAVLAAHGLVRQQAASEGKDLTQPLHLTELGADLCANEHDRERFDGPEADQLISLRNLDAAIRADDSAWRREYGSSMAQLAATDELMRDELSEHAEGLTYLMPALLEAAPWSRDSTLSVHGPGAEVVRRALHGADRAMSVRVIDTDADSQIHARALTHRTDEEALDYLAALSMPELLLIEPTKADLLDPHAAEHQLLQMAITGTPPRTATRLIDLAARAGWTATSTHELGWGVTCVVLHAGGEHATTVTA